MSKKHDCARCGRPAKYVWSICADGNRKRWLCPECDVDLNAMVMRWAFGSGREADIEKYRGEVLTERG